MNPEEDGAKRTLTASMTKVLLHHRKQRGMCLEPHASRCVRTGDVHELVATDHIETAPAARIDRVAFLGFIEFHVAGVLDRDDECWIGQHRVGTLLGFDACHFPNHYNVLVRVESLVSGADLHLAPEMPVRFQQGHAPG